MRIAFIGQKGIPGLGGKIEQDIEEISLRLARDGHEVFVYALSGYTPKEFRKYEQVRLISVPQVKAKILNKFVYYCIACFRACLIEKVNIIHWQKKIAAVFISCLIKIARPNLRQVVSITDDTLVGSRLNDRIANWLLRYMSGLFDQIVVSSAGLQKVLLQKYNISAKLIGDGVNIDKLASQEPQLIKQLGLERDNYVLGVVAQNQTQDLVYLINAFLDAKLRSFRWQNFKLLITSDSGHGFDERTGGLIEKRSDLIVIGDQSQANMAELLKNAYLVIYPGMIEMNNLLQPMSYGKGMLIADRGRNLELINSGLGKAIAFDFKYQDVSDLAEKLELLFINQELVKSVGGQAKKYVALYHDWDQIVAELEKIYRQVVLVDDFKASQGQLRLPEPLKV